MNSVQTPTSPVPPPSAADAAPYAVLPPESAEKPSLESVLEGFRYTRSRQELIGTYVVDIVAMVFGMPLALFPALSQSFGGPKTLGVLYAAPACGALVASLTSRWTSRVHRHGLAVMVAATVWGLAIVAFGFSSRFIPAVVFLAPLLTRRTRVPAPAPGLGPLQRTSILPPRGVSFAPFHFALSPDGTRLAFVGIAEDGHTSLWVRSLDTRVAQEVSETVNSTWPFWAPDSRRVAFYADGNLKVADIGSGAVRVVCEARMGRGGSSSTTSTIV